MRKRGLLIAIPLICFLMAVSTSQAFATSEVYFSMTTGGGATNWRLGAQYVATDVYHGGVGQRYSGNDEYLTEIQILMRLTEDSTVEGYLRGCLLNATSYAHIENSTNVVYISELPEGPSDFDWFPFLFSGDTQLNASLYYIFGCFVENGTGISYTNSLQVRCDSSSGAPNIEGSMYENAYSTWAQTGGLYDLNIAVYTDTEAGGGSEEGSGPPGIIWSGSSTGDLIDAVVGFLVPIVIILLPSLLLIMITKSVSDKWLILIGLVIGAGLGYYFGLVPLWIVFLITIGLIGMAYQSVRGGG